MLPLKHIRILPLPSPSHHHFSLEILQELPNQQLNGSFSNSVILSFFCSKSSHSFLLTGRKSQNGLKLSTRSLPQGPSAFFPDSLYSSHMAFSPPLTHPGSFPDLECFLPSYLQGWRPHSSPCSNISLLVSPPHRSSRLRFYHHQHRELGDETQHGQGNVSFR